MAMIDNGEENALVIQDQAGQILRADQARLNITWAGNNGDLPDPVTFNGGDGDFKQIAAESVRDGYIPGIPADVAVNFDNFVVDRFNASEEVPFNRIFLRPKTPFGA